MPLPRLQLEITFHSMFSVSSQKGGQVFSSQGRAGARFRLSLCDPLSASSTNQGLVQALSRPWQGFRDSLTPVSCCKAGCCIWESQQAFSSFFGMMSLLKYWQRERGVSVRAERSPCPTNTTVVAFTLINELFKAHFSLSHVL